MTKESGAGEDDIIDARCRYRGTSSEYVRFSEAMGIPQQRERVTVDGLGNIGTGAYMHTFSSLIGISTPNGLTISSVASHVKDRSAERKILPSSIRDALTNPLQLGKVRTDRTQQFIGEKVTVAVNVDTEKVVTTWKTGSKLRQKLKVEHTSEKNKK